MFHHLKFKSRFRSCSFRFLYRGKIKTRHACQGDDQQCAHANAQRLLAEGLTHPMPSPPVRLVSPFPPAYHADEPQQQDAAHYQVAVAGILGYPFRKSVYLFVHCLYYWVNNQRLTDLYRMFSRLLLIFYRVKSL